MNTIRLLGAAQLLVFVGGVISLQLHERVVGSGSISDKLVNISNNLTLWRISNLVTLLECLVIVVLGVLFYIVFYEQYKIISLVALGCFLAEAITLAVSKIGLFALSPLSVEFVEAGAPAASYYQTLGDFLYYGVYQQGDNIHMLFFCLGGILWYYLFYRSRYIPRVLSVWGLATVCPLLIITLLVLYDRDLDPVMRSFPVMIMLAPYFVFEALIGPWLMVKGIRDGSETE